MNKTAVAIFLTLSGCFLSAEEDNFSYQFTRESRKLTRTILTQCVHHVAGSSVHLGEYYEKLKYKLASAR